MTSPKQVVGILFFVNKTCVTDYIFPNLLLGNQELNLKVIYNNLINPYFLHMHVLFFSCPDFLLICFLWTCLFLISALTLFYLYSYCKWL